MKKILLFILIILLLPSSSYADNKIRIGYLNIISSLPFLVAQDKGWFTDAGLEIEPVMLGSSNQVVDGLLSGDIDVSVVASNSVYFTADIRSSGKIKIFSIIEQSLKNPLDSLFVRKDSNIMNIEDLSGKRIGVFPGVSARILLSLYLEDQGVDLSDTVFVPLSPQYHLVSLLRDSVDVIHVYEPNVSFANRHEKIRKIFGSVYASIIDYIPTGGQAFSTSFIAEYPEDADNIVDVLSRAVTYIGEHDVEVRKILIDSMKLDEEIAGMVSIPNFVSYDNISLLNMDRMQQYADLLYEKEILQRKIDVMDLIYNEK